MCNVYNFRRFFLCKVTCSEWPKGRMLGSAGLIELVGVDYAERLVSRAWESRGDRFTARLRRGLVFDFYVY